LVVGTVFIAFGLRALFFANGSVLPTSSGVYIALAVCGALFWIWFFYSGIRGIGKLFGFLKATQVTNTETSQSSTAHIQTPLGGADIVVHQSHDPNLDSIARYPDASPVDASAPEYEAHLDFAAHAGRSLYQSFWTTDRLSEVSEFYKCALQLPVWTQDKHLDVATTDLKFRWRDINQGCIRTIDLRAKQEGTLIEHSVIYKSPAS
jgi:hypothetical protein